MLYTVDICWDTEYRNIPGIHSILVEVYTHQGTQGLRGEEEREGLVAWWSPETVSQGQSPHDGMENWRLQTWWRLVLPPSWESALTDHWNRSEMVKDSTTHCGRVAHSDGVHVEIIESGLLHTALQFQCLYTPLKCIVGMHVYIQQQLQLVYGCSIIEQKR